MSLSIAEIAMAARKAELLREIAALLANSPNWNVGKHEPMAGLGGYAICTKCADMGNSINVMRSEACADVITSVPRAEMLRRSLLS